MPCDLDRLLGPLAARLPETNDAPTSFSAATTARLPASLTTDRILIERGFHDYDSTWRVDLLHVHASKSTYRQLALLILSVVFGEEGTTVDLRLAYPASTVRTLRVRLDARGSPTAGYQTRPHAFHYVPRAVSKHPWSAAGIAPQGLPAFYLTHAEEFVGVSDADWRARDTVIGFGSDEGSVRLAELLLNASGSAAATDLFELEGEAGYRGVAPRSCEVRLWLPGSRGWSAHLPPM